MAGVRSIRARLLEISRTKLVGIRLHRNTFQLITMLFSRYTERSLFGPLRLDLRGQSQPEPVGFSISLHSLYYHSSLS
jgi:hypothetical protein